MQEQQQFAPSLYSTKLPTKSQTYFFDVKEAKNGHKFVTITQSRMKDGIRVRNSLIVFSDQLEAFSEIFADVKSKAI